MCERPDPIAVFADISIRMSPSRTFGVLAVGAVQVGVPAAVLREVVAWPQLIVPQLLSPDHVLGVFDYRGKALPVVDLRMLLKADTGGRGEGKIAVLRVREGWLGVAVDGIGDVLRSTEADIHHFSAGAATAEKPLISSLLMPQGGTRAVHLLDVEALLTRSGVIVLAETATAGHEARGNSFLREFLIFECDDVRFCIDARAVKHVIDHPEIEQTCSMGPDYVGMLRTDAGMVAVLDLFNLLAIPGTGRTKSKMLLLDVRDHEIAIPISDVVAVTRLSDDHVLPTPTYGLRRPHLFSGVLACEATGKDTLMLSTDAMLLSHEAIMHDRNVTALQRLHDGLGKADERGHHSASRGTRTAFLEFEAGEPHLAGFADIQDIIAFPQQYLPIGSADGRMLGMLRRRGEMVPMISFRKLAGLAEKQPDKDTRVLIVSGERSLFAFVVDSTIAVRQMLVQQKIVANAISNDDRTGCVHRRMVQVNGPEGEQVMAVLDLRELAHELERDMPAA
jgi:purine-binding chemotaxis protein CheW